MKAVIYQPARTAMQSGENNTHCWRLDLKPATGPYTDPLMGWTGMSDTTQELRLSFVSEEEAVAYAKKNNINYQIVKPKKKISKPKSYAANFAYNRIS